MAIEALIARYGLAALFLGAGIEGEAVVVAGGLLAHQGVFPLAGACIAAAAGSFLADQAWFAVGRRFREHRLVRRAKGKAAFARALTALERHPIGFIFAFRFIYGFRTVSPIAIGTTAVPARTFLLVNAMAAAVWGVVFSLVGYLFGNAFERLVGRLRPHGEKLWWVVAALVIAGLIVAAIHWWRTREA
ncbi:membrane protein DedA, SNARE-associated domain [Sphingomonas gellani]|uniref:Membrane protein DedA, SNARE-associated domain n=1 Tax=Sphingomonas gellani TaxID=1166340 RepID=A0A1H8DPG5_9SPHN|nr:DedA family protein [Sphingomonas gellani]SEN08458.1 membrane protein DedA, SNARE-associated domain [Sphingomonas gellani]